MVKRIENLNDVCEKIYTFHAKELFDFRWFRTGYKRIEAFLKEHLQVRNHYDLYRSDWDLRIYRDVTNVYKHYRVAMDLLSNENPFMKSPQEYKALLRVYSQAKGTRFADENCMTNKRIGRNSSPI